MKINDIIVEAGLAQKLGSAAGQAFAAGQSFKAGADKGEKAMTKLLSPSKWFDRDSKDVTSADSKPVKTYEYRLVLQSVIGNQSLMDQDISTLKSLFQNIKSGKVKVSGDLNQNLQSLKKAYTGQTLDDTDRSVLSNLAKDF